MFHHRLHSARPLHLECRILSVRVTHSSVSQVYPELPLLPSEPTVLMVCYIKYSASNLICWYKLDKVNVLASIFFWSQIYNLNLVITCTYVFSAFTAEKADMKKVYDTANFYHFLHTLALMGVPLTKRPYLVNLFVLIVQFIVAIKNCPRMIHFWLFQTILFRFWDHPWN